MDFYFETTDFFNFDIISLYLSFELEPIYKWDIFVWSCQHGWLDVHEMKKKRQRSGNVDIFFMTTNKLDNSMCCRKNKIAVRNIFQVLIGRTIHFF